MTFERDLILWQTQHVALQDKSQDPTIQNRHIKQGTVVTAHLGVNVGHEKNKTRPVLVLNYPKLGPIVLVAPLTKTIRRHSDGSLVYRSHYVLTQTAYSFLSVDSAVQCEMLRAIDKSRIERVLGIISSNDLQRIQKRIRFVFDI